MWSDAWTTGQLSAIATMHGFAARQVIFALSGVVLGWATASSAQTATEPASAVVALSADASLAEPINEVLAHIALPEPTPVVEDASGSWIRSDCASRPNVSGVLPLATSNSGIAQTLILPAMPEGSTRSPHRRAVGGYLGCSYGTARGAAGGNGPVDGAGSGSEPPVANRTDIRDCEQPVRRQTFGRRRRCCINVAGWIFVRLNPASGVNSETAFSAAIASKLGYRLPTTRKLFNPVWPKRVLK